MEVFFTLVALVHLYIGQPFPLYDTVNEYETEAECLENATDFSAGVRIMMQGLPVKRVEVWCQERSINSDDEVA